MTEGIIDKVIDEHNRNECKCKHACHNLLRIKQELIAEIEKYRIDKWSTINIDTLIGNGEKK